jgi:hypothetical protein
MTSGMRHALLAIIVLAACNKSDNACDGACKTADTKYAIADKHTVDQESWTAFDGNTYTLLRVEYGGDVDEYSVYCGFIVGGEEYPVYGDFVTDEDVLFDETFDLTGLDLPIFEDDAFDAWLWDTDVEDDILIDCF